MPRLTASRLRMVLPEHGVTVWRKLLRVVLPLRALVILHVEQGPVVAMLVLDGMLQVRVCAIHSQQRSRKCGETWKHVLKGQFQPSALSNCIIHVVLMWFTIQFLRT